MNRRVGALHGLLAAAALGVSACSFADDGIAAPPPPISATEEPPATPPSPVLDHDLAVIWTGPFDVSLANGWAVRDCEGDRVDACVYAADVMLGDVELLNGYPLDDSQQDEDAETVLSDLAEGFLEHFREDRSTGCPSFTFVADPVADVTVGGEPGKRAAFRLTDGDGRVVERVVNHFALQGQTYVIANTDAYVTDGGCLGPSEYDPSFSPDDLAAFEPFLDELVADSPLPPAPTR